MTKVAFHMTLDEASDCFDALNRIYEKLGIQFSGPDPTLPEKIAYLDMALGRIEKEPQLGNHLVLDYERLEYIFTFLANPTDQVQDCLDTFLRLNNKPDEDWVESIEPSTRYYRRSMVDNIRVVKG